MSAPQSIEIIGGGLAGLSLGLALRRADIPVTLSEAGRYPRHRVCGEFITGLAPSTITRLGLAPHLADALHHHDVAWFFGADPTPARRQHLPAPALGLSRHTLDERLAAAFVAAGGTLHTDTRVTDLTSRAGRVFTTGRRRSTARWLGLKFHAHTLALADDLELHLGDQAYVGLARVTADTVNVSGLFARRALCAKGPHLLLGYLQAAGLTALSDRLAHARIDATTCCAVAAVDFDRTLPSPAPDRVALGDAAAMIPPFTGNGMAMAFQSAEAALAPLVAYARGETTWENACQTISHALRRRFRVRLATAGVLHPFLLHTRPQRILRALSRAHLLPLRTLYTALH
jgi:flavin-dependent dehydrogenase